MAGAVGEMDKVTQQNAASAEESSSAASELSGQAEELAAMVGAFQLGSQAAARIGARRPAALHAPPVRHATVASAQAPRPAAAALAPKGGGARPRAPADDLFPMDAETELRDF